MESRKHCTNSATIPVNCPVRARDRHRLPLCGICRMTRRKKPPNLRAKRQLSIRRMNGSATNLVQSDEAATLGVTLGQNTPESGASSIALDNTPSTLAAAENSYIPLPVNALVVQSEHQAML